MTKSRKSCTMTSKQRENLYQICCPLPPFFQISSPLKQDVHRSTVRRGLVAGAPSQRVYEQTQNSRSIQTKLAQTSSAPVLILQYSGAVSKLERMFRSDHAFFCVTHEMDFAKAGFPGRGGSQGLLGQDRIMSRPGCKSSEWARETHLPCSPVACLNTASAF